MAIEPRQPPRYVPTLTAVVEFAGEGTPDAAAAAAERHGSDQAGDTGAERFGASMDSIPILDDALGAEVDAAFEPDPATPDTGHVAPPAEPFIDMASEPIAAEEAQLETILEARSEAMPQAQVDSSPEAMPEAQLETSAEAPLEALPEPQAEAISHIALGPEEREQLRLNVSLLEEDLLHRVLQRIDLGLEQRLTDAVSAAVEHELDVMIGNLRRGVEQVLRGLVSEALAKELSDAQDGSNSVS